MGRVRPCLTQRSSPGAVGCQDLAGDRKHVCRRLATRLRVTSRPRAPCPAPEPEARFPPCAVVISPSRLPEADRKVSSHLTDAETDSERSAPTGVPGVRHPHARPSGVPRLPLPEGHPSLVRATLVSLKLCVRVQYRWVEAGWQRAGPTGRDQLPAWAGGSAAVAATVIQSERGWGPRILRFISAPEPRPG